MTLQEFITQTEALLTSLTGIEELQAKYNKDITDLAALEAMNNPPNQIITQAIADLTVQIETEASDLIVQKAAVEAQKDLLMGENIVYTT